MRNDTAKMIKKMVLLKMYGEEMDEVQKEYALEQPKFKAIYRAAKKNYNRRVRYKNVTKDTISRRQKRLLENKIKAVESGDYSDFNRPFVGEHKKAS